jgi:DNA repair exonuclease SbcCD ATPase subunit
MLVSMKDKGPILVLLLVAVGLGIALIVINKEAADQAKEAADSLATASNTVTSVKKQLAELQTVNQTLESNLTTTRIDFSNKMALADANLRTTEADLQKTVAEAKAETKAVADSNAVALAERDQKIAELDSRNEALDKEAAALHIAITNLEARISATQDKLARSEGDRTFLLKELKTLQAEKFDLEQKFNNIADVREQLHKLKTEAAIARRLDWIRRGMYDSFKQKGGELLVNGSSVPSSASGGANVELKQSGGVKIQTSSPTNAPPK